MLVAEQFVIILAPEDQNPGSSLFRMSTFLLLLYVLPYLFFVLRSWLELKEKNHSIASYTLRNILTHLQLG